MAKSHPAKRGSSTKVRLKQPQTDFLTGGGEMAERVRSFDWSSSSLGPLDDWPQSLKTAVNITLQSPIPMVMLWGEEGIMIYNDAYSVFAGARHPFLLGSKVVEGWPEVAGFNRNVMDKGLKGKTLSYKDQTLTLYRNNIAEEVSMDLNYSPIMDESGKPAGVLAIVVETTTRVRAEQMQREAGVALANEHDRLYELIMQAPAIIAVLRGPNHVFDLANPLYRQRVGAKRDIIGKTVRQALPELKGQGFYERLDQVYRTGKSYIGTEVPVMLDSKGTGQLEQTWSNIVYQPRTNRAGKVQGILVHAVDVTNQVLARKNVEESEEKYRALFDSMDQGFCIIDVLYDQDGKPCDYRFLELNPAFVSQTGLENAVGKTMNDFVPKLEDFWYETYGKVATTGKAVRFESHAENLKRYYEVYAFKVGKIEERKVAVLFTDITVRRKVEVALRESEERYRAFISNSSEGIWRIELEKPVDKTLVPEKQIELFYRYGYMAECNDTMAKMYGYESASELTGKRLAELLIKEDEANVAYLTAFIESGYNLNNIESHELDAHGQSKYFLNSLLGIIEHGFLVRAWGMQQDVTERKRAEAALKESEGRLRFMAGAMPQKIFTALLDGAIDYLNPQWVHYSGLTPEQFKADGWLQLVHPEDAADNLARWQYSLTTGEPFTFEQRLRRADGSYRWHVTRAHAMRDDEGAIMMWIGSNTDIHDVRLGIEREHRLEMKTASLYEQREELIELNKAKDEFISLASHQLRTPATAVKQYLGMVLEGYFGDVSEKQAQMLTQADENNERQLAIVSDLLKVARLDAGKVKLIMMKMELAPLMYSVVSDLNSTFKKHHQTVEIIVEKSDVSATVDADKLRMVLENLLDNASKYSPEGTTITMSLKRMKGRVEIAISDQGFGIKNDDMDKLFRKFSRLDNPLSIVVGGTGLGLYWAKNIMDLHGGSINVASVSGQGSTFTIVLPV